VLLMTIMFANSLRVRQASTSASATTTTTSAIKVEIRNSAANTCITYKGNNAGFVGQFCNGATSQQFTMGQKPDGTYTLAQVDSGYRMAIQDGNLVNGAMLTALKGSGSLGQFYSIIMVGNSTYSFNNEMSGKCIDLLSGSCSSGTKIQQTTCDYTSGSQLWFIELAVIFNEVPINITSNKVLPTPVPGNMNSTQIIDVKNGLCATYMGNNTQLMGTACSNSSTAQQFGVHYNHDLTYSIYHVATKQYLDLPASPSISNNGTIVWTYPRSNQTYQKFFISPINGTYYTIKNTISGNCMDMDCRSFSIDTWNCQSTSLSQQWIINPFVLQPTPAQVLQATSAAQAALPSTALPAAVAAAQTAAAQAATIQAAQTAAVAAAAAQAAASTTH